MRGHLLATSGRRLEDTDQSEFLDITYAYAINPYSEHRNDFRSSLLGYIFDYADAVSDEEGDTTFEGFQKQSLSLLDQLDNFGLE